MRVSALKYTVLTWVSIISMLIILLVPFQGFLTVFGAHLIGHYTALRLWDEILLVVVVVGIFYLLLTDSKIRFNTLYRRLVWLIFGYIALNLVLGLIAYSRHNVTAKALGFGLIVNLRYLIFFLATWAAALRMSKLRHSWRYLVIWPAVIVVVFGLLQIFVLPHNFLSHFGYGLNTIPAMETINHNSKYIRIGSTLRGANPLGAYMILPLSLTLLLVTRSKNPSRKQVLFLLGSLIVLFFSFSRSAWLGALFSLGFIIFMSPLAKKYPKQILGTAGTIVVAALLLVAVFHNNKTFQNYVFHTQSNSAIKTTSDQQHDSALTTGLKQVVKEPLGHGPGTSGPASVYNHNERNPEDYYIQIAEEDGWLGIVLFALIVVGVGYVLWLKKDDPLAMFLFASLIGITVANFLTYAWADDTLAFVWWGLAGIAMAPDKEIKLEKS